jgi:predicted nucleotidyltransferase
MTGIDTALLNKIIKLITDYKKPEKIIIFGSRANGNFKEASDIDIAILGKDWQDKDINIIKHNLDEFIKTPLKFDVVNFYALAKDKLKQEILKKGEVVYG